MVFRHQGAEGIFAAHGAKLEVPFPGSFVVFAVHVEELEGHDLGEGVIDVIEWSGKDM